MESAWPGKVTLRGCSTRTQATASEGLSNKQYRTRHPLPVLVKEGNGDMTQNNRANEVIVYTQPG